MKLRILSLLALGATLLASCRGAASSNSAAAKPSSAASGPSGELTFVVPSFLLEVFDPSRSPSLLDTPSLGSPIFQGLFQEMPPNGDIKPFLLASSTMASGAMSWTFKLKDGIKFSNGDPMTADDVKFSLERYISPESRTSSAATLRATIASVDVVDKLTVRVNLKKPTIDLPQLLTYPGNAALVLPSKYIQQVGWDGFDKKPIGSGPYILAGHKVAESVTYTPNPNTWREKPMFSKITVLAVPEEQTRIAMLKSGKADLVDISAIDKQQVEAAGFKSLVVPATTTYTIFFGGAYGSYPDNPLKKQAVRKALTLALDKKALLQALNAGQGEVATVHQPPNPALGSPNFPATPYDPAQAKQLLQQAGYPNGFPLKFWATDIVACTADTAKQMGEAVADYWGKIGVTTQVVPVSYTILRPKIFGKPVPADMVGTAFDWCTGGNSPTGTLNSLFYSKGSIHTTDVADAETAKALAATTPEQAKTATAAAYQQIYDGYTGISLFYASRVFAGDQKVANYPTTRGLADMLSWWVTNRPS